MLEILSANALRYDPERLFLQLPEQPENPMDFNYEWIGQVYGPDVEKQARSAQNILGPNYFLGIGNGSFYRCDTDIYGLPVPHFRQNSGNPVDRSFTVYPSPIAIKHLLTDRYDIPLQTTLEPVAILPDKQRGPLNKNEYLSFIREGKYPYCVSGDYAGHDNVYDHPRMPYFITESSRGAIIKYANMGFALPRLFGKSFARKFDFANGDLFGAGDRITAIIDGRPKSTMTIEEELVILASSSPRIFLGATRLFKTRNEQRLEAKMRNDMLIGALEEIALDTFSEELLARCKKIVSVARQHGF